MSNTLSQSLLLLAILFSSAVAEDARTVWEYTGGYGPSWFVHEGGTKWVIYRGDGQTFLYKEQVRTDDHIELRGPYTKLLIRLSAEKFETRLADDQPWRLSGKGKWVPSNNLPARIRQAPTGHKIRVVYFVPFNRKEASQCREKIQLIMTMISELVHNDLRSHGFHPKPLEFEMQDDEIKVNLVRALKPADFYIKDAWPNTEFQARRIHKELLPRFGDSKRHFTIVFAETYNEDPSPEAWRGHIAIGSPSPPDGGFAVFSGWLLKDSFSATNREDQIKLFFDKKPVLGRKAFGSSREDSPTFEFVEDGFGAIVQQIGHVLGCPHDYRESRNLMGFGFRRLRQNLDPRVAARDRVGFSKDNARMLMCSRYLATDLTLDDYDPPDVSFSLKRRGRVLTAVIDAKDNTGLRAMLIRTLNGRRLSVVAGRKLNGQEVSLTQRLSADLLREKKLELELMVADEGGNVARAKATIDTTN